MALHGARELFKRVHLSGVKAVCGQMRRCLRHRLEATHAPVIVARACIDSADPVYKVCRHQLR